jgi:lipoprotein-releasing system permease protein
MKIVGLFNTGTTNYDESQTFALLNRVQNLLERPNVANRLILKLQDPQQSAVVTALNICA